MNQDQLGGIIRAIAGPIVAWMAAKGYVGSDTAGLLLSAVVAVGIAGWSFATNKPGTVIPTK